MRCPKRPTLSEATLPSAPAEAKDAPPEVKDSRLRDAILYPILAVFTALVIGAILILVTDKAVVNAWLHFFDDPMGAIEITVQTVVTAYGAMFNGALNIGGIIKGIGAMLRGEGTQQLAVALVPLSESLTQSVPYIFAGLAVAFAFQGGLFNIGGEGQMLVGALCSVYVGFKFTGMPWFVHLPLAMLAGIAGGAIWAGIVGVLKAYTGAHEVINTIMMNWIAISLSCLVAQSRRSHGAPRRAGHAARARDSLHSALSSTPGQPFPCRLLPGPLHGLVDLVDLI